MGVVDAPLAADVSEQVFGGGVFRVRLARQGAAALPARCARV